MSESKSNGSSSGGGCLELFLFIALGWLLLSEIQTPWGVFELDLFPPAIRAVQAPDGASE